MNKYWDDNDVLHNVPAGHIVLRSHLSSCCIEGSGYRTAIEYIEAIYNDHVKGGCYYLSSIKTKIESNPILSVANTSQKQQLKNISNPVKFKKNVVSKAISTLTVYTPTAILAAIDTTGQKYYVDRLDVPLISDKKLITLLENNINKVYSESLSIIEGILDNIHQKNIDEIKLKEFAEKHGGAWTIREASVWLNITTEAARAKLTMLKNEGIVHRFKPAVTGQRTYWSVNDIKKYKPIENITKQQEGQIPTVAYDEIARKDVYQLVVSVNKKYGPLGKIMLSGIGRVNRRKNILYELLLTSCQYNDNQPYVFAGSFIKYYDKLVSEWNKKSAPRKRMNKNFTRKSGGNKKTNQQDNSNVSNIKNIYLVSSSRHSQGYKDVLTKTKGKIKFSGEYFLNGNHDDDALFNLLSRIGAKNGDVICIVRGGGDLQHSSFNPFNNELAKEAIRALTMLNIVVITGVGHASDKVLMQETATYPEITPTDAANRLLSLCGEPMFVPKSTAVSDAAYPVTH